ncbi:MAG: arsenate reductase family protein [Halocynthiibacter sp.]
MKLYGIKTCDSCKKAFKALTNSGQNFEFIDIRQTPLTKSDIEGFYATLGAPLVNTRSTTWRNMDDATRAMDPIPLLEAHPTVMKRPVIATNTGLYLGWGKDVQAALLP